MDKILSARVDESAANRIGSLARRLGTSKKRVLECAIEMYSAQVDKDQESDVFEQTCGVWSGKESTERLVNRSRKAFRDSMRRTRGPRHQR